MVCRTPKASLPQVGQAALPDISLPAPPVAEVSTKRVQNWLIWVNRRPLTKSLKVSIFTAIKALGR